MATISKFYLHDATTSNTGTMPSGVFVLSRDATGDGVGARTPARIANDTIGTLQTSAVITSNADQTLQDWGFRRFVSAPLAAHTFATADGNWTFSYARSENNLLHNQGVQCIIYAWRPSTGAIVGTAANGAALLGTEPTLASTVQAESITGAFFGTITISDGDILVFEICDEFTQGMSTAYVSTFFYDGTTEASITSCASFVTPPVALTLIPPAPLPFPHQSVPFVPTSGGKTMHR